MLGLPYDKEDVERTLGFRYVRSLGMLDLGAKLAGSLRCSRDFIRDEWNGFLGVKVALSPTERR